MRIPARGSICWGMNPDPALVQSLSAELQVTKDTPPTFLFSTTDDSTVPVMNSVMFYSALVKAGVPAEMHLFQHGRSWLGTGGGESGVERVAGSADQVDAGAGLCRAGWCGGGTGGSGREVTMTVAEFAASESGEFTGACSLSGGMAGATGRRRMRLPRMCRMRMGRGSMPICTARRAMRGMPLTGIGGRGGRWREGDLRSEWEAIVGEMLLPTAR